LLNFLWHKSFLISSLSFQHKGWLKRPRNSSPLCGMSCTRNHFFTDTFEHNVSLMWTSIYIIKVAMFDRIFVKYKNSDFCYNLLTEFHF
jgi:hypothetical protein